MSTAVPERPSVRSRVPFVVAVPLVLAGFLLVTGALFAGRVLTPLLGGAPLAWASVLTFLFLMSLTAYCYALASAMWLGTRGPIVHIGVALAGLVLLLLAPPSLDVGSAAISGVDAIVALVRFIGLPSIVLASTVLLLSRWLAAAAPSSVAEYGRASGMFIPTPMTLAGTGVATALVLQPLLFDVRLGLGTERFAWTIGYTVFALIAGSAALGAVSLAGRPSDVLIETEDVGVWASPGTWRLHARRALLAGLVAGLLVAVTTVIAADTISASPVWALTLAVYVASVLIAFSPRGRLLVAAASLASPAAITLLLVTAGFVGSLPSLALLLVQLGGLGIVAAALHGALAATARVAQDSHGFALATLGGAAAGAAFVSVVAPALFPDLWEISILLAAAAAALAVDEALPLRTSLGFSLAPFFSGALRRLVPYAAAALMLVVGMALSRHPGLVVAAAWLAIGGLVVLFAGRRWMLAAALAALFVVTSLVPQGIEHRGRSGAGVSRVVRTDGGALNILVGGTTVRAAQFRDPSRQAEPTTYYGRAGPAEDLFEVGAPNRVSGAATVGVVGLGAGTLSAYQNAFTVVTYFEADPAVVRIAQDPALFTYLSDAPGEPRIVTGQVRASLANEPDASFGLLIVDAFSGRAPQIQLLTVEAISDQLRTLHADGVLAFHITSGTMDVGEPVAAALLQAGLTPMERGDAGASDGELPSRWLATSRSADRIGELRRLGWTDVAPGDLPFTDDHANPISYLRLLP